MKKIYLLLIFIGIAGFGFGQVLPDNWTGDTGIDTYQESSAIHGGSYSCRIDVKTSTQAQCDVTNNVEISVAAGNTYTYKFWANTSEFIRISGVLAWVGATSTYTGQYVGPNTGGWSEFSFSGTVPQGATGVNLSIRCYDVSGFTPTEIQYVDDFTFESPTGSPVSLSNGDMESWPGSGPTITLSTSSLSGFSYVEGNGPSSEQSFTAEGSNLTNNISIAPPTNYEISTVSGVSFSATNPIILTQSSGSVATTPIYTRLKSGLSEGSYNNESITATSSGATSKTVICSGDVTATVPDLLITEIMQNPSDVNDDNGEWFEIYNYGSTTVDIDGFVIKDNASDNHTINNSGPLNISAGSFLVLGINSTTSTNGGVTVDYEYSSFDLANTEDEIILYMTDGITEVDKVEWNTGSNWTVSDGKSMIFIGQTIDDNNSYSNWTTSVQREQYYTNPGSETDFGSPSTNGLYQNLISTTTWTGTGNWSEGNGVGNSNWNNGSPGSHVDVTINGDVTVDMGVISYAVCDDLTISTGNSVTLSVEKALTVSGTLTNANATVGNGLIIESTSSGTGSLICSGTPSATVERFIEYGSSGKWNMLSPSTTSVIGQTFFDASTNDSWLTWYDETSGTNGGANGDGWNYLTTLGESVNVGQGYSYWSSEDETVSFKGNLQTGDLSPDITWTDINHGYNLIGNPFSSAVLWDGTAAWNLTSLESTIWIWNGTQYEGTPSGISPHDIPVGQGFFVRTTASSPSPDITIPASKRLHSSQAFLKNGQNIANSNFNYLIINAQNNQYQDKVFIYFDECGTNDFDNGFDATKMFGLAEAPQLYLVENNWKHSNDFLPPIIEGEERTVAMSYIPGTEGEQKLITDFTYFSGANVTLEDLITGNTQDLKDQHVYSFTGSKDDNPERFLLHFAYSPDGIGEDIEDVSSNIQIYSYGKEVYIRSSDEAINQKGNVFIYDFLGREILQQELETGKLQKIHINADNSYLIVKVVKDGSSKTQKIYIK